MTACAQGSQLLHLKGSELGDFTNMVSYRTGVKLTDPWGRLSGMRGTNVLIKMDWRRVMQQRSSNNPQVVQGSNVCVWRGIHYAGGNPLAGITKGDMA